MTSRAERDRLTERARKIIKRWARALELHDAALDTAERSRRKFWLQGWARAACRVRSQLGIGGA